jgi:E3 ubiquitin-protein ligase DOA10
MVAFLMTLVSPVVARVLLSLGFGLVSYAFISTIGDQITQAVSSNLDGLPADVYNLLALLGIVDAMGIWLGVLSVVIAVKSVTRLEFLGGGS